MNQIAVIIAMLLTFMPAVAQVRGEIRGTVTSQNGQPVAHAKVSYENLDDHRIMGALVRYAETDDAGKFAFDNLDWGRYAVYPQKEEDGYPNLRFAIYSAGKYQIATVSPTHAVAVVSVSLGPKAAVLHGSISRASDATPLSGRVELRSRDHPERFMATSVSPEYTVFIPPDTDVDVTFRAPGHKPYSLPLHMQVAQDLLLHVKLTPDGPEQHLK
jgi:hypothetical protein